MKRLNAVGSLVDLASRNIERRQDAVRRIAIEVASMPREEAPIACIAVAITPDGHIRCAASNVLPEQVDGLLIALGRIERRLRSHGKQAVIEGAAVIPIRSHVAATSAWLAAYRLSSSLTEVMADLPMVV